MAPNDVLLLDSLVQKSIAQVGDREKSELFELFCFDQILKDAELSFEELESGWTDGGNDGGLDGFFVLVDGKIATEDAAQYARSKRPVIDVHIFTARTTESFQQQPLVHGWFNDRGQFDNALPYVS